MGSPMAPRPTKPSFMVILSSAAELREPRPAVPASSSSTMASVLVEVPPPGQRVEEEGGLGQCPVTARGRRTPCQLGHRHVPADQLGVGRREGATSRPRMPSPSTTQIDSTTAVGGHVGHLAGVGDVDRELAGDPVTSESMTRAGSSPDGQVCRFLVPSSQASTSAM